MTSKPHTIDHRLSKTGLRFSVSGSTHYALNGRNEPIYPCIVRGVCGETRKQNTTKKYSHEMAR
jgi:hypothetical protein